MMRRGPAIVLASILALGLAAGAPARAEEPSERGRAEQMAREAVEQFMRALELMIDSIPQYAMPEFTEDGDIIIRRKRRPQREPPSDSEIDETST